MATGRPAVGIAAATPAPTGETVVAVLAPGPVNPPGQPVLVKAALALVGAVSVTSITLRVRRGSATSGALLGSVPATVTGAQTVPGAIGLVDAAYDGTGYCLTVQAAGAAGTCGPGVLESQPAAPGF